MKMNTRSLIIGIVVIFVLLAVVGYCFFRIGKNVGFQLGGGEGGNTTLVTDNNSPFNFDNLSSVAQDVIYWMEVQSPNVTVDRSGQRIEYQRRFGTNDIARAQNHVPFTIVVPKYLPNTEQHLPTIDGPLDPSDNTSFRIRMTYGVPPNGLIVVTEYTYPHISARPIASPTLEQVEIAGKQVMKSKDNMLFIFEARNVSFIVQSREVPGEEARKVAESIIQQIK